VGPYDLNKFDFYSKPIQTHSNLIWFKQEPQLLQKFEIKYGRKEIEIRNNRPHINISRFKMEFELKFRELL
jgi:hypothetical protein